MLKFKLLTTILLIGFYGISQTGPGGAGAAGDYVGWYSVSDLGLTGGSTIQTLPDLSGNGNDLSQSSTARRPSVVSNSLNNLDVVRFDGTNDYLFANAVTDLNNPSNFAFFSVFSASAGTVMGQKYQGGGSQNNRAFMFAGGSFTAYAPRVSGSTAVTTTSNTNANLHSYFWNNTGDALSGFLNGALYDSKTNADGTPGTHQEFILGRNPNNTSGLLNGDIAELIISTNSFNVTERTLIDNYLGAKYNLTFSTDVYTHQANHGFDVAGIGQETAADNSTDGQGTSIVRINTASDLEDGEYMIWGHDNGGLATNTTEIPVAYVATSGQRLDQEWRVDISGGDNTVGTVSITFDMTGIEFGVNSADYRLLIDADGNFSNSTVNPTAPVVAGSLITFNGITFSDNDHFTIGNSNDISTCTSITTNTWPLSIWDCGSTPDSGSNAIIGNGSTVTIAAGTEQSANDMTVGTGSNEVLILAANSRLIVKGDFTVAAGSSITFGAGSRIILRGINGNQGFVNNGNSALDIENLTIDNANGVTLSGSQDFVINDGLTLRNGDLTANASLFFASSATQTAHIDRVPNGSQINGTGPFGVERFRSARAANWGDIASSGVDTDIEDLNGEVFISGIPGGNGYATNTQGGGFISIFFWDNVTDQYVAPSSTADPFELGVGYEIWLADNQTTWSAQSWSLAGDINLDPTTLDLNTTGSSDWNLLGNPYLGFLDWDQVTTDFTNMTNDEYWYLDADLNTYANVTAGGGATVPPGQGFWVEANNSLDIDLDPALHLADNINSPVFHKRNLSKDQMMIHIEHESEPWGGAAYLRSEPSAYAGRDEFDITPLRMPDPRACHLTIETGEEDLMVNYISEYETEVNIPIRVEAGTSGKYIMDFAGSETFKSYQCKSIVDEQTGELYDVTDDNSFSVNINNTAKDHFFTLRLRNEDAPDCEIDGEDVLNYSTKVWSQQKSIYVDYSFDESVNSETIITNILGEQVYTANSVVSYNRDRIDLSHLSAGAYLVTVSINGTSETHKVILN